MKLRIREAVQLVIFIVLCEMAGAAGSIFTIPSIPSWYAGLRKPGLAPPNWIFAPVWTTLFALMGISLFIVWKKTLGKGSGRFPIAAFIIQLALNIFWSYLFFGLKSPILGMIEIAALWFSILVTVVAFTKVSRTAGAVLLPYLVWVSFAGYLNYMILVLNG
jgi:benzodiazapine receptor